jgi:signal transduction histidine kinase
MPEPIWYRSLYWRIALGFVALLAALLVAQGLVFLWMTGQMADLFPSRSPSQFAATLASDTAALLAQSPDADLNDFVARSHPRAYRGFVIALADGRFAVSQRVPPPPGLLEWARRRLGLDPFPDRRGPPPGLGPGRGPDFGRGFPEGPGRGGRFRGGPGGPGPGGPGPPVEFAQVIVDGRQIGVVGVPVGPPPLAQTIRDIGPTLAVVAFGLLVAGTSIAALVIFRPAHRRLRQLHQAANALGAGASGVRAEESGGDEVTLLARAFNDMASRLEERSAALDAADRARRQLLADVSHELTTPLAAIRGYVETLAMPNLAIDDTTRQRYLQIIHEETERLEHIVGDLLDLAKLDGGGATFRLDPVPVAQLFDRIHRRHQPVMRQKHITLRTAVADDVTTVPGDQNRLEQALQNLVANAARHTPDGGTISVNAERVAGGVSLSVDDTGPGIPPEHLAHVFDRFYKVDVSRTGTDLPSGSGLGLSIVQAIVTRHGGTVTASNLPDRGARFRIVLPD